MNKIRCIKGVLKGNKINNIYTVTKLKTLKVTENELSFFQLKNNMILKQLRINSLEAVDFI